MSGASGATVAAARKGQRQDDVHGRGHGSALAGFRTMLGLALRRERVKLPVWVLGIAAFTAYCSAAMQLAISSDADLKAMASLMSGPAGILLVGPGYGFDAPTHASLFAGGYGLYIIILAACMSILLVMRHTRGEEESERLELLRSLPLARATPLAVATLLLVVANVVAGLLVWGILAARFDPVSSALFALGVAVTGIVFGAAALVTAQLSEHSRTASGLAFLVLGLGFVVRGIGDVWGIGAGAEHSAAERGTWLSWLSPFAWAQQTRVYVDDRWWPPLIGVACAVVLVSLAAWLQSTRDLGAGLVPPREGRAFASPLLRGAFSLAFRVDRGSMIGWAFAGLVTGAAFGALTTEVSDSLGSLNDPLVLAALGGQADKLVDGYLQVCLLFGVILACCFVVLAVQRLVTAERVGRTELALSLPLGRVRWGLAALVVAVVGGGLILAATGLATGVATAVTMSDAGQTLRLTWASLTYLPAVAVVASVALFGYALRPGLVGIAWVVFGYSAFVSMLGGMLQLPEWAERVSVFYPVGQPPLNAGHAWLQLVLALAALFLTAVASLRLHRRDLPL